MMAFLIYLLLVILTSVILVKMSGKNDDESIRICCILGIFFPAAWVLITLTLLVEGVNYIVKSFAKII